MLVAIHASAALAATPAAPIAPASKRAAAPEAAPGTDGGDAVPALPPLDAAAPPADDEVPALPPLDTAPAAGDAVPALPPLDTAPSGEAGGAPRDGFVDAGALASLARGAALHGYLQLYAALGVRGEHRRDWVLVEERLQLDLQSELGPLRITGRPAIVHDAVRDEARVGFRELYAARDYERLELSVGDRIVAWGITDFWPVVDIVNPRDYRVLRIWRPSDEKLPVPMLRAAAVLGRVTLRALATALAGDSAYELDRSRPFAIPIVVPPEVPIRRHEVPGTLARSGGGAVVDVSLASWKLSLYGLWGRNPLPTAFARVDAATGAPEVRVENDRVAMAAASAQGPIAALRTLIKAEAAYYHRVDDRCEGATEVAPGTPSCFYLRRVPTGRATLGIERAIVDGLDAHLQLIAELTREADVPALPAAATQLAPGLEPQHRLNPIATLRLQGRFARGDFRPSAFVYASLADRDCLANLDLEYHVADGFALAIGGFWFEGYADDAARNRFTIAGSLESSSNAYLRASAWF